MKQPREPNWSEEQTNAFCDVIADGGSFSAAAAAAGKSKAAGSSKWRKIIRSLGEQAA